MHELKVYLCLVPIIFVIDYLWLGNIMSNFYLKELGSMAREKNGAFAPVIWAAVLVYALIPLGIVIFVLPGLPVENFFLPTLGKGFLFGIVLYGVYDMTNYSLVNNWSLKLSAVDIVWGGSLNAMGSLAGKYLDNWIS